MMDERPRYRNGVLVYTAKDIYDDVSAGMDPDCLFVSLEKFEAERVNNSAGSRRGRAGMSRLEEVKAELKSILERDEGMMKAWTGAYDLACTLADEVDELRKAGRGFRDRCKAVSLEYAKVCTDIAALEAEIQQFRDAYAHDREIMADQAAELEAYEARMDALEAERDELQRRLAQILDRLPEGSVWCYDCNRATVPIRCESFYEHIPREYKQMKTTFHCPICKRETYAKDSCVDSLRAIAEGRDNGN